MDGATRRSLDILKPERGEARNSLLGAVDRTLSAGGRRELAARLASPLAESAGIRTRQAEAEALAADLPLADAIRARLRGLPDLERALARLSVGRFAPRDLAAIRHLYVDLRYGPLPTESGLRRLKHLVNRLRP